MKRKVVLRLLSLVMVASMTGTMLPSNIQTASAEEVDVTEKTAALEDGINDAWTQDNKADGDTVTVENGWLHIKSAAGNRNNPGTRPQMVVNPNTFDFNKPGYFSFTLKSNNANTGISDSDRVGVYLGYNTDQNGMYIGYDNGGWFWQKYKAEKAKGHVLLPDTVRFICEANGYDAEKIGQHFLEILPKICPKEE